MPLPIIVTLVSTCATWIYYAAINPTVGAALVAAFASVGQTLILLRHERRVDKRLDERRLVVTHIDDNAVVMTNEERRELELDRADKRRHHKADTRRTDRK